MAAVSVGRRPTFYGADGELLVEAYLLDFAGDLYGEPARLSFVHRLRDELAFDSVDALVAQMGRDVDRHPDRCSAAPADRPGALRVGLLAQDLQHPGAESGRLVVVVVVRAVPGPAEGGAALGALEPVGFLVLRDLREVRFFLRGLLPSDPIRPSWQVRRPVLVRWSDDARATAAQPVAPPEPRVSRSARCTGAELAPAEVRRVTRPVPRRLATRPTPGSAGRRDWPRPTTAADPTRSPDPVRRPARRPAARCAARASGSCPPGCGAAPRRGTSSGWGC